MWSTSARYYGKIKEKADFLNVQTLYPWALQVELINIPFMYHHSSFFYRFNFVKPNGETSLHLQINYQYWFPILPLEDILTTKVMKEVKHTAETLLSKPAWMSFKSSATFSSQLHFSISCRRKWIYETILHIRWRRDICIRTRNN
jgi:hypothetical protein